MTNNMPLEGEIFVNQIMLNIFAQSPFTPQRPGNLITGPGILSWFDLPFTMLLAQRGTPGFVLDLSWIPDSEKIAVPEGTSKFYFWTPVLYTDGKVSSPGSSNPEDDYAKLYELYKNDLLPIFEKNGFKEFIPHSIETRVRPVTISAALTST